MYRIVGDFRFMRVISGTARGTKLFSLDGLNTRPTLDRVKEPLFSKLQFKIADTNVLDLFAGSGALGIEALSRGAKLSVFCDNSKDAINIINKNIEKTRFKSNSKVYTLKFEEALHKIKMDGLKFDLVFLDPPYKTDYIQKSLQLILEYDLLNEWAIVVLETDEKDRVIKQIENMDIDICDVRKYGRVTLIFLERKG